MQKEQHATRTTKWRRKNLRNPDGGWAMRIAKVCKACKFSKNAANYGPSKVWALNQPPTTHPRGGKHPWPPVILPAHALVGPHFAEQLAAETAGSVCRYGWMLPLAQCFPDTNLGVLGNSQN